MHTIHDCFLSGRRQTISCMCIVQFARRCHYWLTFCGHCVHNSPTFVRMSVCLSVCLSVWMSNWMTPNFGRIRSKPNVQKKIEAEVRTKYLASVAEGKFLTRSTKSNNPKKGLKAVIMYVACACRLGSSDIESTQSRPVFGLHT